MGKFVASLAFSTLISITAAAAATSGAGLGEISGKVMVDQGNGYVAAAPAMNLKAGDRIFIGKDSMATVNYGACKMTVSKATVYTVAAQAPCAAGEKTAYLAEDQAHIGGAVITPANGGIGGAFDFTAETAPAAGVAAAIAIAVVAVLATHEWTNTGHASISAP